MPSSRATSVSTEQLPPRNRDRPHLERRDDGAVIFRARSGRMEGFAFRVYDVAVVEDRARRVPMESGRASRRVFVQADSGRWTYAFSASESRALDPALLEQQLQAATYTMPDHTRGNPR